MLSLVHGCFADLVLALYCFLEALSLIAFVVTQSPVAIDDSDEELHDRGVEADVRDERAFLSPHAQAARLQQDKKRSVLIDWQHARYLRFWLRY